MWVNIILFVLFFSLGVLFFRGKGTSFIAGYNTMDEKERAKINEKALCRGMAMLMLAICLSLVLFFIGGWQNADWLITAGTIWMVVAIISALIIFNTSERFKNEG